MVAVVGYSGSGKTAVAAALIERLTARGYRVGAVKHCPHGHDAARPGSDSDRMFHAGAVAVIAASPGVQTRTSLADGEADFNALARALGGGVDMVVAEGFKSSCLPKIVVRGRDGTSPVVENMIAEVCADDSGADGAPAISESDLTHLTDQLAEAAARTDEAAESTTLMIDGAQVPLKDFPSRALAGLLRGFLSSLDGVTDPHEVRVLLGRNQNGTGHDMIDVSTHGLAQDMTAISTERLEPMQPANEEGSTCHYLQEGCGGGIVILEPDEIIGNRGGWADLADTECLQPDGHDLLVHSTWVMWRSAEHNHPLGITEGVCDRCRRDLYGVNAVQTDDDDDD